MRAGTNSSTPGFVYFLCSGKFVKIGFATNLLRRMDEIGSKMPGLRLKAYMLGTMAKERELHRRFASSRVQGEWFRTSKELRAVMRAATKVKKREFAPLLTPEKREAAWERLKYWDVPQRELQRYMKTDPIGVTNEQGRRHCTAEREAERERAARRERDRISDAALLARKR